MMNQEFGVLCVFSCSADITFKIWNIIENKSARSKLSSRGKVCKVVKTVLKCGWRYTLHTSYIYIIQFTYLIMYIFIIQARPETFSNKTTLAKEFFYPCIYSFETYFPKWNRWFIREQLVRINVSRHWGHVVLELMWEYTALVEYN